MWRIKIAFTIIAVFFILVIVRLFYWQIISSDKLSTLAYQQYFSQKNVPASRGIIKTSDGFSLVDNQEAYLMEVNKNDLKISPDNLAEQVAPFLADSLNVYIGKDKNSQATDSGRIYIPTIDEIKQTIMQKLNSAGGVWIPLVHKLDREVKDKIEKLNIKGVVFLSEQKRYYPEASMAAHLLGFVGQDYYGQDQGYFGLEGFYDRELKGKPGLYQQEKDAFGRPIVIGQQIQDNPEDGRTLDLYLDRTVQFIVESKLKEGIEKYGAKGGLAVVMDPKTGGIIAMSSFPSYAPGLWYQYDPKLFKNPVVADSYEPGSTFKVLVMAAAINEHKINPDTKCDKCSGPREIGGYTIRTWNNQYFPNTNMTQVLEHSDNTGMIFTQERLGKNNFLNYLKAFGFGQPTGIDLQDESSVELRPDREWLPIDLATASFGQGIAVTPIQMVTAVSVLANGGRLMEPHMVKSVETDSGDRIVIKPKIVRQVISPQSAKILTEMMIEAVDKGEAKWAKPVGYRIAGKTGTAQVAIAGHYDASKTIASFVGFAPADDPKFVMLVRLSEPSSSIWGSETAAPLFFNIAKELFSYYGIVPKQ
ncbi:MAG: penicillin-binding protein 2 [Patescibacteria group bacterium]|nr:penicillin-binding protein 2 [Patescibacteria group bacterium]